jgi:hypothetical protein
MKVVIDGKVYEGKMIDELSIKHALLFDRECADQGYPWRWADVERVRAEVKALSRDAAEQHPEALLLTAVSVWAARILAGDDVTFTEAISTPFDRMAFLFDEAERPAEEAPDPHRARPDSGRANAPASSSPKKTSGKTSKRRSTPA